MVWLSHSESVTLCRRVFTALDYPAGADFELAKVIVWLAATRILPLRYFANSLPCLYYQATAVDSTPPPNFAAHHSVEITIDNLVCLIETIDLLTAYVIQRKERGRVNVSASNYLATLIPLALARADLGVTFRMIVADNCMVIAKQQIWADFNLRQVDFWRQQKNGVIDCAVTCSQAIPSAFNRVDLNEYYNPLVLQSVSSQRIAIDADSLHRLKNKASESFVPNSELSRRSGAGAEVDDND